MKNLLLVICCLVAATLSAQNTENRTVGTFSKLSVSGSIDVSITQGTGGGIVVVADTDMMPFVKTEVKDGQLNVYIDKNNSRKNWGSKVSVAITAAQLSEISMAGSGNIATKGNFNFRDLEVSQAGSGNLNLGGTAADIDISMAGSGNTNLADLSCSSAKVSLAGSGSVKTAAKKSLNVSIAGSGNVCYTSKPDDVQTDIAGSGNVCACK